MSYVVSFILFVTSLICINPELMIASGLFAIAGAIAYKDLKGKEKENEN